MPAGRVEAEARPLDSESPIEEGQNACLTLFTDDAWTLDSQTNKSKSVASPFYGKQLKGKVLGIVNNGQLILN